MCCCYCCFLSWKEINTSSLIDSSQFWPCMKMSSSALRRGAPGEVTSTATVAPTGGTRLPPRSFCRRVALSLWPVSLLSPRHQSFRLSHRCRSQGLQTSGREPEMQTDTWPLAEVMLATRKSWGCFFPLITGAASLVRKSAGQEKTKQKMAKSHI